MTTDTSKAPERIWTSEVALFDSGRSAGSYYTDRYSSPAGNEYATEYVRADIHAAMQARAEKAEGALERISQYPIPRPYCRKGVEIPEAMRGIARAALERKEGA